MSKSLHIFCSWKGFWELTEIRDYKMSTFHLYEAPLCSKILRFSSQLYSTSYTQMYVKNALDVWHPRYIFLEIVFVIVFTFL